MIKIHEIKTPDAHKVSITCEDEKELEMFINFQYSSQLTYKYNLCESTTVLTREGK